MDKNQMIKNFDPDTSFLSLSLNERLYLSDTGLYSKSGFNVYRPQAQKAETSFYQDLKQNSINSIKYSQSNSLLQIDQAKYQVLNGQDQSQRKNTDDYDLVRNKLEVVHNSINSLRNDLALLHETVKNSSKNEQIISLFDKKLAELSLKSEKFENFLLKLPFDIEVVIKKSLNDALLFLEKSIDHKMNEQVEHAKYKTESGKKLSSIRKPKINKYHLLNKLKNYKNIVLDASESNVRKRRVIENELKHFKNPNEKYGINSQDSIDSLFEFEI